MPVMAETADPDATMEKVREDGETSAYRPREGAPLVPAVTVIYRQDAEGNKRPARLDLSYWAGGKATTLVRLRRSELLEMGILMARDLVAGMKGLEREMAVKQKALYEKLLEEAKAGEKTLLRKSARKLATELVIEEQWSERMEIWGMWITMVGMGFFEDLLPTQGTIPQVEIKSRVDVLIGKMAKYLGEVRAMHKDLETMVQTRIGEFMLQMMGKEGWREPGKKKRRRATVSGKVGEPKVRSSMEAAIIKQEVKHDGTVDTGTSGGTVAADTAKADSGSVGN
jgi:hypothetical protein